MEPSFTVVSVVKGEQRRACRRLGPPADLSLDTEFIAFGIEHDDAVLSSPLFKLMMLGRPDAHESFDFPVDLPLSLLQRDAGSPARVDVNMEPVLSWLGRVHLLEVDSGALAFGVDDSAGRVPFFFGYPHFLEPRFPRLVSAGRVLQLVVQGLRVEFRETVGIFAVEDDLELERHYPATEDNDILA